MKAALLIILERYFLALAKMILSIYRPVIIGITGSVGKTTTKEAVAHVLTETGHSVRKTAANLNTDLGIALSVLGYDHSPAIWEWPWAFVALHLRWLGLLLHIIRLPDYYVVEMGIDRLGDMSRMIKSVQPTVGIVTWIGEGHHLEFLKDPATIAQEKGQMLTVLPKDGLAILPAKDEQLPILEKLATAPVVKIEATGQAALPEILRALGKYLHIKEAAMDAAIKTRKPTKGRLNSLAGINDATLIDDTYNSSLPSVKLALQVLAQTKGKRKIAVLADVLEQGKQEGSVHREIARLAKQQADIFVGVGKRMKQVPTDFWYASPEEAAAALIDMVQAGDIVLVKGSQGMRMEKVSYALAADKAEAREQLPRQGSRWQQIPFSNP